MIKEFEDVGIGEVELRGNHSEAIWALKIVRDENSTDLATVDQGLWKEYFKALYLSKLQPKNIEATLL